MTSACRTCGGDHHEIVHEFPPATCDCGAVLPVGEFRKRLCKRCRSRGPTQPTFPGLDRRLRGEVAPRARLTTESVLEIRARSISGEVQRTLAAEMGISRQAVSLIVRRRTWKHL